jgi:DNA polymerase-4
VGRAGAELGRHAAGVDTSRIRPTALPPSRIDDRELTPPTADAAAVQAGVAAEVERVGRDLRGRGVFARTLTLRLRLVDGRVESRTVTLREPSALDGVLLAAATDLLPRVWAGERLVRAVGVSCGGLIPARRSAALFAI